MKAIPKDETHWVSYKIEGVIKYTITSKSSRDYYYIYEHLPGGTVERLGKAKTPIDLEHKFIKI